jgi:hypothetical protein
VGTRRDCSQRDRRSVQPGENRARLWIGGEQRRSESLAGDGDSGGEAVSGRRPRTNHGHVVITVITLQVSTRYHHIFDPQTGASARSLVVLVLRCRGAEYSQSVNPGAADARILADLKGRATCPHDELS